MDVMQRVIRKQNRELCYSIEEKNMTKHVNIFIEYINYLNQIQKKSALISLYIYIYILLFVVFFWLSIFNYAI